ncbi:MAG: hypothetical protein WDN27_04310 [Candidatus Saccharibacteria bacterium]
MRNEKMREQLNTEITRKQFLQYMAGATLMVLGFNNLFSLLSGHRSIQHVMHHYDGGDLEASFGSRRFGG